MGTVRGGTRRHRKGVVVIVEATIVLRYRADNADTAYRKAEDVMDLLRHDPDIASVFGDDRGDGYIVEDPDEEEES